jgi:hypothetical protein
VTAENVRRNSLLDDVKLLDEVEREVLMLNEDICVTEHGPDAFAFLRMIDGYTNDVLRESLDPELNKDMVFKAGESQGKSGSFFFFSKD